MAFVHGKGTAVSLDGNDLSAYSNSVTFTRTADTHETTTFGKSAKTYVAGLTDGTASIEGFYDSSTEAGPAAVIQPLIGGDPVELVYMVEGESAGKPSSTVEVLVTSYEQSAPVADMVTFSVELQFSDDIADATQS